MSHSPALQHLHGFSLALGILLCISAASATEVPESGRDTSIVGEWTIKSVLDYASISIGADQAKPLIGKELIISEDTVRFGNQVCTEPNFVAESVETNIELKQNARVSNSQLRLPNPVTVVELSCAYAYIKDRNRIVLAWNGIFFDAVRKKRGATLHSRQNPPSAQ